ncbi:hypothetical protein SELMODRAFT_419281 [Selaginella moellendorffii]|uniref:Uncharacterized protein n=1 Tax=Selaginella moellendorffii TaxID=88036 RepID=D8S8F0_SELML|nr:hypothetical protein SELMODRAFT_419281 [Selaginella moellendorffii]
MKLGGGDKELAAKETGKSLMVPSIKEKETGNKQGLRRRTVHRSRERAKDQELTKELWIHSRTGRKKSERKFTSDVASGRGIKDCEAAELGKIEHGECHIVSRDARGHGLEIAGAARIGSDDVLKTRAAIVRWSRLAGLDVSATMKLQFKLNVEIF